MYKGLYADGEQHVIIKEFPEQELQEGQVLLQTEFAAIKHGTEFHLFGGSPFSTRRFDPEQRLFVEYTEQDERPEGRFLGNMVVGKIAAVGSAVTSLQVGDRVYGYGPACDYLVREEATFTRLPSEMSESDAVCLDPAFYAFAAVRDARAGVGSNVIVSGMGAIGLFVIQLLKINGCLHIIAVDPLEKRRQLASKLGADLVIDPTRQDVGLIVREYLGGRGADVAIEASGNYRALANAVRSVHNCCRIVTLGYYKGLDTVLELGAEWHHNRLELISSMPVWDNPLRDYPQWDQERLARTLIEMFRRQWLTSKGIVDPVVPFSQAADAFLSIYQNPSEAIKMGIRF